MSLKATPHQLRNQRVNPPKAIRNQPTGPPVRSSPWNPIGGGIPAGSQPNAIPTVIGGDQNLTAEQRRNLNPAERSFLEKQEARHTKPNLSDGSNIKIRIPAGGLSPNQVAQYYKLVETPAGEWRVGVRRTVNGIAFAMVGPKDLDPMTEIEKILKLTQMTAIGKNAIDYTARPIVKGNSKMFKVDIKAKPIYRKG